MRSGKNEVSARRLFLPRLSRSMNSRFKFRVPLTSNGYNVPKLGTLSRADRLTEDADSDSIKSISAWIRAALLHISRFAHARPDGTWLSTTHSPGGGTETSFRSLKEVLHGTEPAKTEFDPKRKHDVCEDLMRLGEFQPCVTKLKEKGNGSEGEAISKLHDFLIDYVEKINSTAFDEGVFLTVGRSHFPEFWSSYMLDRL